MEFALKKYLKQCCFRLLMRIINTYISRNVPPNLVGKVEATLKKLEVLPGLCQGAVSRQLMAGVNVKKRVLGTLGRIYYSIQDFDANGAFLKSVPLYHYSVHNVLDNGKLN
jgi:hypothetical protein